MSEVDAIKAIADALEPLDSEERGRVLAWAQSKYGTVGAVALTPSENANAGQQTPADAASSATASHTAPPARSKAKSPKKTKKTKTKTIISMDKSLNLSPKGKQSAVDFAEAKAPSNVREKCVVAVSYLRDVIELDNVSAQGVFTFFKTVKWPVPADLKNTLQQAGTTGWLDTGNSEDIKLTTLGENLVEHELPAKLKAKV